MILRARIETHFPGVSARTLHRAMERASDRLESLGEERAVEVVAARLAELRAEARAHPPLDLSGVPLIPRCALDGEPVAAAKFVSFIPPAAHGIPAVAAHDPERVAILAIERWKYPGGGRGDAVWREYGVEEFVSENGWVRDPER